MEYKLAKAKDQDQLLNSNIECFQSRIDRHSINVYYKIDQDLTYYFKINKPSEYQLNKRKDNIMDLAAKLNNINGNTGNGNTGNDLAAKLNAGNLAKADQGNDLAAKLNAGNKSALAKADLDITKFAEVEALRNTIKDQGVLIVNCVNAINDLNKLAFENNNIIAIIGKDQKSTLNAINTMAAKFAGIGNTGNTGNPAKAVISNTGNDTILRKADHSKAVITGNDQEIQQVYELFKGHFNHKFAKSSKADQLNEFKVFISLIDLYSLQSINDTARASWQSFRTDTDTMLFAPGSMALAITALIKLAKDLDYIKDLAPIIDKKAKAEIIAALNDQFADNTKADLTSDNTANSVIKDFDYWKDLFAVKKETIADCVSLLKLQSINDGNTKAVIRDHLIDNTIGSINDTDLAAFNDYLANTNFAG